MIFGKYFFPERGGIAFDVQHELVEERPLKFKGRALDAGEPLGRESGGPGVGQPQLLKPFRAQKGQIDRGA